MAAMVETFEGNSLSSDSDTEEISGDEEKLYVGNLLGFPPDFIRYPAAPRQVPATKDYTLRAIPPYKGTILETTTGGRTYHCSLRGSLYGFGSTSPTKMAASVETSMSKKDQLEFSRSLAERAMLSQQIHQLRKQPVPPGAEERRCVYCMERVVRQYRCSRCKQCYYCGPTCQLKDWPTHKAICAPPLE